MEILNQIVITDNIKLIRIKQDFDEEKLKVHLKKLKDKEIEDYLGFSENIEEEIEDIKGKIERKTNIYYAIYKQDEFIGWFYLYDIKERYRRANLSLGIQKDMRGHILSLDMVKSLIENLFSMGFNRLGLEIEDTNIKSLKLAKHLEQIGFQYEGKLRDNYGENINSHVWSLLKREYIK